MIRSAALSVSCMASRKGLVGPSPSSGAGVAFAEAARLQPEVLRTLIGTLKRDDVAPRV